MISALRLSPARRFGRSGSVYAATLVLASPLDSVSFMVVDGVEWLALHVERGIQVQPL